MPKLKTHVVLTQYSTKALHMVTQDHECCWNSIHFCLEAGGGGKVPPLQVYTCSPQESPLPSPHF